MIKYALKCGDGHQFESWFQDSATYDRLEQSGHLACAICGVGTVKKAIMAPRVNVKPVSGAEKAENPPDSPSPVDAGPLSAPASPAEQALKKFREHVEANAENVGKEFVTVARAMHSGDAPERPIFGEARMDEAKALIDEGMQIAPLPWGNNKVN